jgi:hypothetical protein
MRWRSFPRQKPPGIRHLCGLVELFEIKLDRAINGLDKAGGPLSSSKKSTAFGDILALSFDLTT